MELKSWNKSSKVPHPEAERGMGALRNKGPGLESDSDGETER